MRESDQANDEANDEASRLTRRRFVQFSGLAGAGVLAGASVLAEPALAVPPPHPDPKQCGSTNLSSDSLWKKSQECHSKNTCLQNDTDYVVMPGNDNKSHYVNYILVPTERINGIECPWICGSNAPNYWSAADYYARKSSTVVPSPVGLGINSKLARHYNQLHIHMAKARPESLSDLSSQQGLAAKTVANWADSRVSIRGWSDTHYKIIPHTYRVLIWPGFSHDNLFTMLRTMLVHALGHGATTADAQARMAEQTLIVIPRSTWGYYIVTSNDDLKDPNNTHLTGSGTCDPLLLMHP